MENLMQRSDILAFLVSFRHYWPADLGTGLFYQYVVGTPAQGRGVDRLHPLGGLGYRLSNLRLGPLVGSLSGASAGSKSAREQRVE